MTGTTATRFLTEEVTVGICRSICPDSIPFQWHPDFLCGATSSLSVHWTIPTPWLQRWAHGSDLAIREFHAADHGN